MDGGSLGDSVIPIMQRMVPFHKRISSDAQPHCRLQGVPHSSCLAALELTLFRLITFELSRHMRRGSCSNLSC